MTDSHDLEMHMKTKFCKTKIICTLGPACDDEKTLKALIHEGLDGARFNFSHGTYEEHKVRLDRVRKVEAELGVKIPCILDTKGPEIRTGNFKEPVELKEGQKFTFTINEVEGDANHCTVSHKGLVKDVQPGTKILIDDGLVETVVESVSDTDVVCKVLNNGVVKSHKSLNIPGAKITLPALTEKDINDLKFGVENKYNMVAASFIRTKNDILTIKQHLKELGGEHIKIIAKIESQEGIDNFDEILKVTDGVMVARGDLGVEIPIERIPIEQKKMIRKCARAGKIVITATQMLDSMINNPRPTRAEVTDIANAIIDGTSVIMLSGETAAGKYPVEAVRYMNTIAFETEKHLNLTELAFSLNDFRNKNVEDEDIYREVITYSVAVTANLLKAAAIICITKEGRKPRNLSKFRAKAPIFAITANEDLARELSLEWNVQPVYVKKYSSSRDLTQKGIKKLKELGFLFEGDTVVLSGKAEKSDGENTASVVGGVMKII